MKTVTVTLTDEELATLDVALVKLAREQRNRAFRYDAEREHPRHDTEAAAAQARECRRRAILADLLARKLDRCSPRMSEVVGSSLSM